MGLYKNNNGVLSPIAGRGKAEYGASTVRTGTFSLSGTRWVRQNITFAEPMPDTDYIVSLETTTASYTTGTPYTIDNKTVNGFQLSIYSGDDVAISYNGTYTAFKLYTDNEYNGLLNNQRYSTDEIDTGKTWIDGKKIYRKVVDCGALPNNTTKTVPHGISNLDMVIKIESMAKNPSVNYYLPLPFPDTSLQGTMQVYVRPADIQIVTGTNRTTFSQSFVIIEYTKTTD